jgi:hypothetical protein
MPWNLITNRFKDIDGYNDYRSKQGINVNQSFPELSIAIQEHTAVACWLQHGNVFCEAALCHVDILGSGGTVPPFLTSSLDGGEWSPSHPSGFTPGTYFIGGWMSRFESGGGEENLSPPRNQTPPSSPSLYRLSYVSDHFLTTYENQICLRRILRSISDTIIIVQFTFIVEIEP